MADDDILNGGTTPASDPDPASDPTPDPEPTPPTILDKVKFALRISHDLLNGEIEDVITSARQELVRAGVNESVAESDMELVETAIKTYALEYYASDEKEADRYGNSFKYQCDCLRKSTITVEG